MLTLACVAAPPVRYVEHLLTDPVGHAQHALAALKLTGVRNLQVTRRNTRAHQPMIIRTMTKSGAIRQWCTDTNGANQSQSKPATLGLFPPPAVLCVSP